MELTMTNPVQDIENAEMTYEIYSSESNLEIETDNYLYNIDFEVITEYESGDAEVGYIGGFYVTEVFTEVKDVYNKEGDLVNISECDKRKIEKYLNNTLNLECYGRNF